MFEDFFKNASSLGLDIIREKNIPSKEETKKTETNQKAYEQISQQVAPAPVASPINSQYLMYGGAAVGVLVLILLLKGK